MRRGHLTTNNDGKALLNKNQRCYMTQYSWQW